VAWRGAMKINGLPVADRSNSSRTSVKQRTVFPLPAGPSKNRACTPDFRECEVRQERTIS